MDRSTARFDYVRIRLSSDRARMADEIAFLVDFFIEVGRTMLQPGDPAALVSTWNRHRKEAIFFFEVWGEAADLVENLPYDKYRTRITRLDARVEVPIIGTSKFTDAAARATSNGSNKLNAQLFKTRERTKREGRDAGGHGVAIGSHKSVFRAVLYRRTGGRCAMEGQFSKAYLARFFDNANIKGFQEVSDLQRWHALKQDMLEVTAARLEAAIGIADVSLEGWLMQEGIEITIPDDRINAAQIDGAFRCLSQDEQWAVYRKLSALLYGQKEGMAFSPAEVVE